MNPEMFTTDKDLVTIVPAISFAFGRPKDRSTENAAGATTAPKNNAAPSHAAKRMSLIELRISLDLSKTAADGDAYGPSIRSQHSVKIVDLCQEPDFGMPNCRYWVITWIRHTQ